MSDYASTYYQTVNYTDYLERGPRYERIAVELDGLFQSLSLVPSEARILDFGCGIGFLVHALLRLGYNATGCDISQWAREEAARRGLLIRDHPSPAHAMIALDVFEHMTDDAITEAISTTNPKLLIARIPCSGDANPSMFHLQVSRRDPTHINCKTARTWEAFLRASGFTTVQRLRLFTIYDSPGVACFLALRP